MAGSAGLAGDYARMTKSELQDEVANLRARLDVAERERDALRESEGRLSTVIDHMPAVV